MALTASLVEAAHAETFTYSCKMRGQADTLIIDDAHSKLTWKGAIYKTQEINDESCPRYGLHATRPGESFDFCTATKGYADFNDQGSRVVCHQVAVPDDYLGHWALVPAQNEACKPKDGAVEVTTDNIHNNREDYCHILDATEIKEPDDPRVEITCTWGGEGGQEFETHETWRLRDLLGKQIFVEQGVGGITFRQRCP